jgi:hypothetical protein
MATWQLDQGSGDTWTVPTTDSDGNAVAYSGFEVLSGKLWPGGGLAPAYSFTPTWGTAAYPGTAGAALGLTSVTIPGSVTATLAAQTYRVVCTVTDSGGAHDYYRGYLQILADPAAVAAPPVYCSIDDLRDHAAWIDDLQAESDLAGFARQRGSARAWLDAIILARYAGSGGGGSAGMQLGNPGSGAWSLGSGGGGGEGVSKYLRDQLALDLLIVTDQVREITAKRALHYICRGQVGRGDERPYEALARSFARDAEEAVKTYRAEVDLGGDGYADIIVNCGATSLR